MKFVWFFRWLCTPIGSGKCNKCWYTFCLGNFLTLLQDRFNLKWIFSSFEHRCKSIFLYISCVSKVDYNFYIVISWIRPQTINAFCVYKMSSAIVGFRNIWWPFMTSIIKNHICSVVFRTCKFFANESKGKLWKLRNNTKGLGFEI